MAAVDRRALGRDFVVLVVHHSLVRLRREEAVDDPAGSAVRANFRWRCFEVALAGVAERAAGREVQGVGDAVGAALGILEEVPGDDEPAPGQEALWSRETGVGELSRQDAAAEAERIRAATREEETKVERAAQAEILAAERAARLELKALIAQLAVARAESLLRDQVTPERQAVLMRAFVQNVGRAN